MFIVEKYGEAIIHDSGQCQQKYTALNCLENSFQDLAPDVTLGTSVTVRVRLLSLLDESHAFQDAKEFQGSEGLRYYYVVLVECLWDRDVTIDHRDILHKDDSRYYVDGEVQYICEHGYTQSGIIRCLKCKKGDKLILKHGYY